MGLFDKLKQGLKKTTQLLKTDVRDIFKAGEILDESKLERFESRLVQADLGVKAADEIVTELRKQYLGRTVVDEAVWTVVKDKLKSILKGEASPSWNVNDPLSPLEAVADGADGDPGRRRQRLGQDDLDLQARQAACKTRIKRCCWPPATRSAPRPSNN